LPTDETLVDLDGVEADVLVDDEEVEPVGAADDGDRSRARRLIHPTT